MEHCEFKNVGSGKPCAKKPVKKSKYCSMHKYLMKHTKAFPCKYCRVRTYSKFGARKRCADAHFLRYYNVVKPFNTECRRLRNILFYHKDKCFSDPEIR